MSIQHDETITLPTREALLGITDSHIHYVTEDIGIHCQMFEAWLSLEKTAKEDGITLCIASGFRSFERQLSIWNRKCSGQLDILNKEEKVIDTANFSKLDKIKAIMLFSALPGTSRHHWGTDIDVYAPNLLDEGYKLKLQVQEYDSNGPLYELNKWLSEKAAKFGFYRPYDKFRNGVYREPWHLSYDPLANQFEQCLSVEIIKAQLINSDIEIKTAIVENLDLLFEQYVTNTGNFTRG